MKMMPPSRLDRFQFLHKPKMCSLKEECKKEMYLQIMGYKKEKLKLSLANTKLKKKMEYKLVMLKRNLINTKMTKPKEYKLEMWKPKAGDMLKRRPIV